jgi:hypothetical protein
LKKWKLSEWWPWWWSDMKVTCCDQIRTISSLQNVVATTPKRMFFPQMTFKDQKTMMMYIVELIKKALSFGQTPPSTQNVVSWIPSMWQLIFSWRITVLLNLVDIYLWLSWLSMIY